MLFHTATISFSFPFISSFAVDTAMPPQPIYAHPSFPIFYILQYKTPAFPSDSYKSIILVQKEKRYQNFILLLKNG